MKDDLFDQNFKGTQLDYSDPATYISREEAAPPPEGFAPLYYFLLSFKIIRWDDLSVRRASRDPKAGLYGAFFWAISATIILLLTTLPLMLRKLQTPGPAMIIGATVALIFELVFMAIITFAQLGLCHLIAKWFCGATGTFAGVMRPLLLGWFVNLMILIPGIGLFAAAIAWSFVLVLVFEEVDRIGRLQAYYIAFGINVCFIALQLAMHPHR